MTDHSSPKNAELASFGIDRKRLWILKFEDADRSDMHFEDEGDAHHAYECFNVGWNCTLLETSVRKYDVRCGKLVPIRIRAQLAPDPTNHHNALKCQYCNPDGLSFAPPQQMTEQDPAQGTLERLSIEKLAKHFRVSVEQAKAAQDDIGFMYRELASAFTSPESKTP